MAEEIRITLRLPPDVYSIVKSAAEQNNRSMNEEIVKSLSTHYNVTDEIRMRIAQLEKAVAALEAR